MKWINRRVLTRVAEGVVLWLIVGAVAGFLVWFLAPQKALGAYKAPNLYERTIEAFRGNFRLLPSPPRQIDNVVSLGVVNSDSDKAIDEWLDKLAKCESGNRPTAINPHDFGSGSYGLYQWKVDSFYRYNQIYKVLPDLEKHEVMNIIYDPIAQTALTKAVIKDGGYKNWHNCVKKLGKY